MGNTQFVQNGPGFVFDIQTRSAAARPAGDDNRFQRVQMHALRQGLRQINHFLRPRSRGKGHQIFAVKLQCPLSGVQVSQGAQQGGFARAIRPQQSGDLPAREKRGVQPTNNLFLAIAGVQIADAQAFGHTFPRLRIMMLRKNGTPTSEVTMPTGIITPGTMFLENTEASDSTSAPISMLPGR